MFCASASQGGRTTEAFCRVNAVCRDPLNPNGYFLADDTSIRYFDEATNSVRLVAGADEQGTADGIGSDARFSEIGSLLVTSDGRTLWCGDSAVREVSVATGQVTTHKCSASEVFRLCWDRASTVAPDSAFYCTTVQEGIWFSRFDTATRRMHACPPFQRRDLVRSGADYVVSTGHIIYRGWRWLSARMCI